MFFLISNSKNGTNDKCINEKALKMIDLIEIENHSICRPKIYQRFQRVGEFNQKQAMATLICNRIV